MTWSLLLSLISFFDLKFYVWGLTSGTIFLCSTRDLWTGPIRIENDVDDGELNEVNTRLIRLTPHRSFTSFRTSVRALAHNDKASLFYIGKDASLRSALHGTEFAIMDHR